MVTDEKLSVSAMRDQQHTYTVGVFEKVQLFYSMEV
jgi:hypothetical protein